MAEAVLFNLANGILESLGSFAYQKIRLLDDAKDELQSLEDTVRAIQVVLLDAEKQQWHNNQVKLWLQNLKDVLYDVHDLFDDVAIEDLRRNVISSNKMSKTVRIFFSKSNQLTHRLEVTNKIRELTKELRRIRKDRTFHLEERRSEETAATGRGKKRELPSLDENIIGREEEKKKIKQLLFDSSSRQSVSFVALVGKGGLGKTALARLVYNDREVRGHFELRMWACVSDFSDLNSIIKEILRSEIDNREGRDENEKKELRQALENKTLEQLAKSLHEIIKGKKYLLVLDDLWNEERRNWLTFGEWLVGGERGSKVLVTTRSHTVAKVMDAKSVIHDLHGLPQDESWNLFRKWLLEMVWNHQTRNWSGWLKIWPRNALGFPLPLEL
ncbi:uncharacterized protein J3R85_001649 [Psidium guajava]|nr:uncharacterized protein J3R85_001649 [Psidium guajava]